MIGAMPIGAVRFRTMGGGEVAVQPEAVVALQGADWGTRIFSGSQSWDVPDTLLVVAEKMGWNLFTEDSP